MHEETHAVTRIGWLRAAILGANDGIVSTASLIAGVAAASLVVLAILGALGAWGGNAPMLRPVVRVTFGGAMAMAATIAIGSLLGTVAG